MPILSSEEIRQAFLAFFQKQQHEIVASSSLIPHNDPTLLFTNAGMVQFKEVFLGQEKRDYTRATSSQRCVRAGGKHNDLERVGYTARHHTFFEMLGNFSFGDYFKCEAIHFAWDFLTNHLKLPAKKLWITVYKDDQEAADIWLKDIKVDPQRFSYCGEADNFWSMGPTGPCGPCTEIFYDHGSNIAGGPPGSAEADGDRYIEIWNIVFMQYDRNAAGEMKLLPKPSVDTGMGLERIAAVLQGVHNNYDTDLFQPIIKTMAQLASTLDLTNTSLRVIADHIRSCAFLIADGVIPSNEGRGYVLRRIIRRALRHGHQLGISEPFFYKLLNPLIQVMGKAYPLLIENRQRIETTLKQEEEQFGTTLSQGLKIFEESIKNLEKKRIPGDVVFKLYDTYGFPADLTADIARERGLEIDVQGFNTAMETQRERSRQSHQFTATYHVMENAPTAATEFVGHHLTEKTYLGKVLALYHEGQFTDALKVGEKGSIILDKTPFYAEAGGQIGDQGTLSGDQILFKVTDTIKQGQSHLHLGKLEKGTIKVGDTLTAQVDAKRRAATVLNHTATHLLHHVLHEVLGEHAIQKGSLVAPERLRFDFAHSKALTDDELSLIEKKVNEEIRNNHTAKVKVTSHEEAIAGGAVALFGEKYGKQVRVVQFGKSVELCGGTHAEHTGDIGLFKIISESGIASGIRRIEAVTGEAVLPFFTKCQSEWQERLSVLEQKNSTLEKEILSLKEKMITLISKELTPQIIDLGEVKILAALVAGIDSKSARLLMDHLKQQLERAVIVLITIKDQRAAIIAGVTPNLTATFKANELIQLLSKAFGGKGGGKAETAEGGGPNLGAIENALVLTRTWVQNKLSQPS